MEGRDQDRLSSPSSGSSQERISPRLRHEAPLPSSPGLPPGATTALPSSAPSARSTSVPLGGEEGPAAHLQHKSLEQEILNFLRHNYAEDPDTSTPRDQVYTHYCEVCKEKGIAPIGQAGFGKAVRLVFPEVKTRRLGVRGLSKYHYHGIKLRPLADPVRHSNEDFHPPRPLYQPPKRHRSDRSFGYREPEKIPTAETMIEYFDTKVALWLPPFAGPSESSGFGPLYERHCNDVYELFRTGDLSKLGKELTNVLVSFWTPFSEQDFQVLQSRGILDHIFDCDAVLYSAVAKVYLPDIQSDIPLEVSQAIRNLSKHLPGTYAEAIEKLVPNSIFQIKMDLVGAFVQILRRTTSLIHLCQAAKTVWSNPLQLAQMRDDWNSIEFRNVHEQTSFACECDERTLDFLENQFSTCLETGAPIKEWTKFLENFLHKSLYSQSAADHRSQTKHFLLKWSYYSSALIRDLTLRSATSFGSFHLIRLFFEEYLHYITDREYTQARARELSSYFPPNFFMHIHPSMTTILDPSLNQRSKPSAAQFSPGFHAPFGSFAPHSNTSFALSAAPSSSSALPASSSSTSSSSSSSSPAHPPLLSSTSSSAPPPSSPAPASAGPPSLAASSSSNASSSSAAAVAAAAAAAAVAALNSPTHHFHPLAQHPNARSHPQAGGSRQGPHHHHPAYSPHAHPHHASPFPSSLPALTNLPPMHDPHGEALQPLPHFPFVHTDRDGRSFSLPFSGAAPPTQLPHGQLGPHGQYQTY